MKNTKEVNSDLTYEQLKKYKGFENVTEAEAEKQIEFIKKLAKVMYFMYIEENKQNKTDYENRP